MCGHKFEESLARSSQVGFAPGKQIAGICLAACLLNNFIHPFWMQVEYSEETQEYESLWVLFCRLSGAGFCGFHCGVGCELVSGILLVYFFR